MLERNLIDFAANNVRRHKMVGYIQAEELAKRWDISMRQVSIFVSTDALKALLSSEIHGLSRKMQKAHTQVS